MDLKFKLMMSVKSELNNLLIDYRDDVFIPYRDNYRNLNYHPDFMLSNNIMIDVYDTFRGGDRKRYKLVKEQHPMIDIRVIFYLPNVRIPELETTYGCWCVENGIQYSVDSIPPSWLYYTPPQYIKLPMYLVGDHNKMTHYRHCNK